MKKIIALAIALIMALTLAACSDSNGRDNAPGSTDNPPDTTLGGNNGGGNNETSSGARNETVTLAYAPPAIGDYIYFGDYDWQILDIQDGKALLLSNYVWENKAYHNGAAVHVDDLVEITWADCDLRAYLNGEFYNSFDADDRAKIVTVTNQTPDNTWFSTGVGGEDTQDNIFILSLDEVVKYLSFDAGEIQNQLQNGNPLSTDDEPTPWISDGFLGEQARETNHIDAGPIGSIAGMGDAQRAWWLRSPGGNGYMASFVGTYGKVDVMGMITTGREFDGYTGLFIGEESGIYMRPAMWITLDTPSETPNSGGGETQDGGGETPSYIDRGERGNTVFNNLSGGIAAQKDGWIYYVDRAAGLPNPHYTICKIRLDGSERTELMAEDRWTVREDDREITFDFPGNRPENLNVVGDWVYFTLDYVMEDRLRDDGGGWEFVRGGHYICKIRTDGTEGGPVLRKGDSTEQINGHPADGRIGAAHTIFYQDTMTVIGDWIYYIRATESGEDNGLYKVRTDGTQDTLLVKGDAVWRVSVIGDWIFYMLKGEAYRVRTDGAQRTKIRIDYEIECMDYWEVDWGGDSEVEIVENMYFFNIEDIVVDGEHMYLQSYSNWYRFDMNMRNEVRLNFRSGAGYGDRDFINVSDGWLYYVEEIVEGQIGDRTYHYNLCRIRLDTAQTVMLDGWSSPQIDASTEGILLCELPGTYYAHMRMATVGDWLFCDNGDDFGNIRADGTEYEDIRGQMFSKWGVLKTSAWRYVDDQALEGASDRIIEMEISKGVYAPGETITVTIGGVTQEMADDPAYVGIFQFSTGFNGDRSYPPAGNSTLTLTAPNEEGVYNIGLYEQYFNDLGEYEYDVIILYIDFAVDSGG